MTRHYIPDPERPYLDVHPGGWICSKCQRPSRDGDLHTRYCAVAVRDRTTRNDTQFLGTHSPWPARIRGNSTNSDTLVIARTPDMPTAFDPRFDDRQYKFKTDRIEYLYIRFGPMGERRARKSRWPIYAFQRRAWDPVQRIIFQSFVEWTELIPPGGPPHNRFTRMETKCNS